ncbi:MAG: hypothetical protein AAFY15_10850, partial [Cyanobacteria bacterium J06648_11]
LGIGLVGGLPVSAQLESDGSRGMVLIVLDGRELFYVSNIEDFATRERSHLASAVRDFDSVLGWDRRIYDGRSVRSS